MKIVTVLMPRLPIQITVFARKPQLKDIQESSVDREKEPVSILTVLREDGWMDSTRTSGMAPK